MANKRCRVCQQVKPLSEFYSDKSRSDGHSNACKSCRKTLDKKRYDANQAKILEQKRQYYAENKDTLLERNRCWHENNREWGRAYGKIKYAKNAQYHAEYRAKNRDKHRIYYQAKRAVRSAIRRGDIIAPSECLCASCGEQAREYHHPSYERKDWLSVVPLCKSCHRKLHAGTLSLEVQE